MNAAEANRHFWSDPTMRIEQTARVNGGDGSPHARPVPVVAPPRPRVAHRRYSAVTGRPVRRVKRRARRAATRAQAAAAVTFGATLFLLNVLGIPAIAAVTIGAALGVAYLAWK